MQQHIVLKPGPVQGTTVSNTATGFAPPQTDTIGGIVTIETADVRMRWDGTNPTAGVGGGQLMKKDSVWEVTGRDLLTDMRFFADDDDAYVTLAELKGY